MKKLIFVFTIFLLSEFTHAARQWERFTLPGGACGNGGSYHFYYSSKNLKKLALVLPGGNACWSKATCYNTKKPLANMFPVEYVPTNDQVLSENSSRSPLHDYSIVYLPYCTGDVFLGHHQTRYGEFRAYHFGRLNIENTVKYLVSQSIVSLDQLEEFVLYGSSAGAIGALFHIKTIAPMVDHISNKTLLLDAPGLHFGDSFWHKFTEQQLQDYSQALSELGFPFSADNGNVSSAFTLVCQNYVEWKIAMLQGSKDKTMSLLFGGISPNNHEKLLYSDAGVYGKTNSVDDNCAVWAPSTFAHTFLNKTRNSKIEAGPYNAVQYSKFVIQSPGILGPNWGRPAGTNKINFVH